MERTGRSLRLGCSESVSNPRRKLGDLCSDVRIGANKIAWARVTAIQDLDDHAGYALWRNAAPRRACRVAPSRSNLAGVLIKRGGRKLREHLVSGLSARFPNRGGHDPRLDEGHLNAGGCKFRTQAVDKPTKPNFEA